MSDFNTTISFDVFNVSLSFVDEGTFIVVKQYVDEHYTLLADTVSENTEDISDLQANKADKETTYTKSEVEQIKLELLNLIYAGL